MAQRVLTLYCAGYSIADIADRLCIKVSEVKFYLGLFRD